MTGYKVFLSLPILKPGTDILTENGCEIIMMESRDKQIIKKQLAGVDAMLIKPDLAVDKEILDAAGPQLKVIGLHSVGYNHVDLDECKRRGIKVSFCPSITDYAVADAAVLLLLAAARQLQEARMGYDKGQFLSSLRGKELKNSTVGIVGLGGIGQATVKRLKGFDVKAFLYTGHREKPEGKELGAEFVTLDTLLQRSDFVIISTPLTEETRGMCNKEFFAKMKNDGVFVNISRGLVVNQDDLIHALKNNEIFAAGIDVTTPEPLPVDHEMLKLPNLVIMPHQGNATKPARESMAVLSAKNVTRALEGQELLTPVP